MNTTDHPTSAPTEPIPAAITCDWYSMHASIDLRDVLSDLAREEVDILAEDGSDLQDHLGLDSNVADAWVERHPVHPASAIIAFARAHPDAYFEITLGDDRSAIREWRRQHDPGSPASTTQSP